jgi:hypothetical protein
MITCLSFVGILPEYIIECVHQIRCYYNGEIYLIINDLNSVHLQKIEKYNVIIIDYKTVISDIFLQTADNHIKKILYIDTLYGREELFLRSFERFFLLQNLLKQTDKNDCLFLELDNLIYDDPHKWIDSFSKHELCYMFDSEKRYDNPIRFASGLMYVKNADALNGFLSCILDMINNSSGFISEMIALGIYYEMNKDKVGVLPSYWNDPRVPQIAYLNYDKYNDTIFDASAMGIYLLGMDPFHTGGVIVKNIKSYWADIDYTQQIFDWKIDETGRKRPYILNGEKWLLINVLHVHSKDLKNGLSTDITI